VAFHTFGCKLNQFETEALASSFRAHGFAVVPAEQEADAYLVNTCTVTSRADHKARSLIRGIARDHPHAPLLVTGCSAQTEAEELAALSSNIIVVPQSEKPRILRLARVLAESLVAGNEGSPGTTVEASKSRLLAALGDDAPPDPFALTVSDFSFHTRAFLKIQDGCNCSCAYCRVPLARGRSVSLGLQEVLDRAAGMESRGRREIVLTGVNISAWEANGTDLAGLLVRLLGSTTRVRLRLSSLEPESITPRLLEVLKDPRVCPHFHIPVQSGSDNVLALMRRRYRSARVIDDVQRLKELRNDPFIAADIMVGFPGETQEDFDQTRSLVQGLEFSALHVFPFSSRPGTAAAGMKPVVPERVRRERATALKRLGEELSASYSRRWAGKVVNVLLEGKPGNRPHGVSENYLKMYVDGAPGTEAVPGRIVRAEIIGGSPAHVGEFRGFAD
jgi:threonylcarbamoyladenosine tRNA methylthiotransferase MtaB